MNVIQKVTSAIDAWQQKHRVSGFIYAVIKKYGDDKASYQAALLTYYGFLSLFPLLLVLATVAGIVARNNPSAQQSIISSVNDYFPVLGNQLSGHVQTLHKSGIALAIGLVLTLYGARGVADALRYGINQIWSVPHTQQAGFPKSVLKSLSLILVGGIGLIGASAIASLAAAAGHGIAFRLLSILLNLCILFALFVVIMKISLTRKISFQELRLGAAVAAIGLVILQLVGGYVLTRELKNLDALYSNFAVALGLLFWIFLQAQVLYYAVEVASVRAFRLWPRSLTGNRLTDGDKRTYSRQTASTEKDQKQNIATSFND